MDCNGKRHYDTEFEAEVAAVKAGHLLGTDMKHYPHRNHWHIANRSRSLRGQHPKYRQCEPCGQSVGVERWDRHIATGRHQRQTEKERL